jgi:predicted anti-sigma-YlaC factor YlaD
MEETFMDCLDFQKQVSLLIDGVLSGTDKKTLDRHLENCPECSNVYQLMATLNEQVRSLKAPATKTALAQKIKTRIASRKNLRSSDPGFLPHWARAPLFATIILLALGLGNFAGRSLFEVFIMYQPENVVDLLVQENRQSFGEVVMNIGSGEDMR